MTGDLYDWREIAMSVASILTKFDDILYTWCLIYMLAGAGIYFTVRTHFVQLRLLKDCFKCMFENACLRRNHRIMEYLHSRL